MFSEEMVAEIRLEEGKERGKGVWPCSPPSPRHVGTPPHS